MPLLAAVALTFGCKSELGPPAESGESQAQAEPPATRAIDAGSVDSPGLKPAPAVPDSPLGLPDRVSNPSRTAVALGRVLFFDPRISASGRTACSTCHRPDHGWASPQTRTRTDGGQLNARHTPTLWSTGRAEAWPWDGQATNLAAMIRVHWRGQLGDPAQAMNRLGTFPGYQAHFQRAFRAEPSARRAAQALAAFVSILETGNSPWDRYEAGDRKAVDAEVVAGFEVFRNIAQCALCHSPPMYTDHGFHRLRVARELADPGRMRATGRELDRGAFRTPGLRGLLHTAPYLHDGSAATLEEVVDRKLAGGIKTGDPTVDRRLANVRLSPVQRRQLLAFLRALSNAAPPGYQRPHLPEPPSYDAGVSDAPSPATP
jgi:cytochrome c peroxidase